MSALNAEDTIEMTIRSIVAQTETNWELILTDDGSSDRTGEIAHSFADQRIRVYREELTLGAGVRANQGIDLARGQFIARMDADDICYPQRLARQLAYLTQHPEVDLLATEALIIDDDNRAVGLYPQTGTTHAEIIARRFSGFHFAQPTWMGSADWFRRIRYAGSKIRSQDQDLLYRSYRTSRFALLPEVLVGYRRNTIPLWKLVRGRRHLAASMIQHLTAAGEPIGAVRAMTMQVIKGGVDIVAAGLRLSHLIERRRVSELPDGIQKGWEECLRQINSIPNPSEQ